MDYLQQLQSRFRQSLFAIIAVENIVIIGIDWFLSHHTHLSDILVAIISIFSGLLVSVVAVLIISRLIIQPIKALWQVVMHLNPTEQGTPAPNIAGLRLGKELVTNLATQIYQLTDVAQKALQEQQDNSQSLTHNFVAQSLPLPLLTLDDSETIIFANEAAAQYIGINANDMTGKNVYMVLDMSFPNEDTFDGWLKQAKTSTATSTHTWERVRLNVRDDHPALMFDLASYYNRDNPLHQETMLVLFDHTKSYMQDDQAVSFIALSVHELRTPLTLLRGYIEVFEDELNTTGNAELQGFMQKMRSQAEQLTAFVNNILNVARVDGDQLQLQLQEENWTEVLKASIEALSLRAKVRGITLHCRFATDLPTVGVDHISVQEVVNNFVDNAIKYSGQSKTIEIATYLNAEGLVETTVQDFGLGISTATVPNLFTKFYRDHRNRAQIGGTGLGLYLSKAIITAHGGTVFVTSKENEGSTFGFTLLPFSQLAEEAKANGEKISPAAPTAGSKTTPYIAVNLIQ